MGGWKSGKSKDFWTGKVNDPKRSKKRKNNLVFCRKCPIVIEDVTYKGQEVQVNVGRCLASIKETNKKINIDNLQLKMFVKPVNDEYFTKNGDKQIAYYVTIMGFEI